MLSRVLLITTGGTIASGLSGGRMGHGQDLLAAMPEAVREVELDLVDLFRLPSSQIGPEQMLQLSQEANRRLGEGEYVGGVITHGTDTLEETALFLHLLHRPAFPLVVTGAMRSGSEVGPDGPSNLQMAIAVCCNVDAQDRGVMVVLNEQIHAARYVTKTHSKDVATFKSPDAGPIGQVYAGDVKWLVPPDPAVHKPLLVEGITARVDLIKAYAGADGSLVDAALQSGAGGIVVEGMGVGNLPARLAEAMGKAAKAGIPAVLATRCGSGPVRASSHLRDAGVITAGLGFNGQKARIALLVALSAKLGRPDIESLLK